MLLTQVNVITQCNQGENLIALIKLKVKLDQKWVVASSPFINVQVSDMQNRIIQLK